MVHIGHNSSFSHLRTKQSIGYVVFFAKSELSNGTQFVYELVQGMK